MSTATATRFCRNCLVELPADRDDRPETMYCGACLEKQPLVQQPAETGLTCPACDATTERAVKGRFFFECPSCNRTVERLDGSEGSVRTGLKTRRVSVDAQRDGVRIAYRWPIVSGVFLTLLTAAGCGIASLVPFEAMVADGAAIARTVVGVSILALLGYGALTYLFNRTVIDCRDGGVTVSVEPLPWQRRMSVRAARVRRVYTTLYWTRMGTRGPKVKRYDVRMELENGESHFLLHGIDRREDAFAASDALRRWVEGLRPENW